MISKIQTIIADRHLNYIYRRYQKIIILKGKTMKEKNCVKIQFNSTLKHREHLLKCVHICTRVHKLIFPQKIQPHKTQKREKANI